MRVECSGRTAIVGTGEQHRGSLVGRRGSSCLEMDIQTMTDMAEISYLRKELRTTIEAAARFRKEAEASRALLLEAHDELTRINEKIIVDAAVVGGIRKHLCTCGQGDTETKGHVDFCELKRSDVRH